MDYAELSAKFKPLAEQDFATRYEQGDLLVLARPLPAEIQKLATEWEYSYTTLVSRINVAAAFPQGHRARRMAWTIADYLVRAISDPDDREVILNQRALSDWSVNLMKSAIRRFKDKESTSRLARTLSIPGWGTIRASVAKDGGLIVDFDFMSAFTYRASPSKSHAEQRFFIEEV